VARALTALLPLAPYADIAHVRHAHTDYDRLLAEGYDRDAARFFVIDQINETLTRWRATRMMEESE
jgi:hypothetical protein